METNQLTLEIISPEKLEIEPIKFNYENLKGAIVNIANTYKEIEYSDDQLKLAKTDRATLRKFRNALEDKRKEVKAMCLRPYEDFESKIKDLVKLIDEPINLIDKQVKEYEQQITDEKLSKAVEYFNGKSKELGLEKIVTWEKVFDSKFNNLTMTLKKITEQLDEQLERIQNDWQIIDDLETPFSFEIKKVYQETLDLGQALAKNNELKLEAEEKEAYEKKMAERKAEEEAQRKAEIEEKAEVLSGTEDKVHEPFYELEDKEKEIEYTLAFKVTGTKEALMKLSNFLKSNNYKFEQMEV